MTRLPRFYVYLLLAREDGSTYIGYTSSLRKRIARHNAGRGGRTTKGKNWHLVDVRMVLDQGSALELERQLKRRWSRVQWLRRLGRPGGRLRRLCQRYGIDHQGLHETP